MDSIWKSVSGAAVGFFLLGYYSPSMLNTPSSSLASTNLATDESSSMDILVYNDYTLTKPVEKYPWTYLAEPYVATTLAPSKTSAGASFEWWVDGELVATTETTEFTFTEIGHHTVQFKQISDDSEHQVEADVMVKYVRRELRTMTDYDRESFFQAMMVIQRVPGEVGRKLYGARYMDKDEITRLHMYYGGTLDCDHWHIGAGFVTSHMTYTLMFEQSLQSVFPWVTCPYWDFTMEATFYDYTNWRDTKVFAHDWYGEASPDNDMHTVTQGKWRYNPSKAYSDEFSSIHNSYGVFRSPWNSDPTPFMTRSKLLFGEADDNIPGTCEKYSASIDVDNWMTFSKFLNSAAHGHIHEGVGGSWFLELPGIDIEPNDQMLQFAHEVEALSKDLLRAGYLTCPETCSLDTPASECQCTCTDEAMAMDPTEMMNNAGVFAMIDYYDGDGVAIEGFTDGDGNVYEVIPGYTAEETSDIFHHLRAVLCANAHFGDMYQSSSPNDVTFWTIHPLIDRLWHLQRLDKDPAFNETWLPFHTCYGHNPTDIQPFSNTFDLERTEFYTNEELYTLLDPAGEALPYVYDNFDWPHCSYIGVDIKAYEASSSSSKKKSHGHSH